MLVETLLGDFGGHTDPIDTTVDARPDVWAHNIEVVRAPPAHHPRRALQLRAVALPCWSGRRRATRTIITKSSIMVGVGETDDEVRDTMRDLRAAGVDIVTLGQYLRPTPKHAAVDRFVPPEVFDGWAAEARAMGFAFAASGPLVRSSYKAAEVFVKSVLRPGNPAAAEALLRERLAEAQAASGGTMSASELASRAASSMLIPSARLVRRA